MWPFEGNHEANVASGENEFDTPGIVCTRCFSFLYSENAMVGKSTHEKHKYVG